MKNKTEVEAPKEEYEIEAERRANLIRENVALIKQWRAEAGKLVEQDIDLAQALLTQIIIMRDAVRVMTEQLVERAFLPSDLEELNFD